MSAFAIVKGDMADIAFIDNLLQRIPLITGQFGNAANAGAGSTAASAVFSVSGSAMSVANDLVAICVSVFGGGSFAIVA